MGGGKSQANADNSPQRHIVISAVLMGRDTRGISDTGPGPPDTAGNLIDSQFAQEDMMKVVSAAPEGFFA